MPKIDEINFSEFYINEFFGKVRQKVEKEYSEENFAVFTELFRLLSQQSEITEGISVLAEEHASSELSIFLFDIFDRAQDYPPTDLIDALPEIAEDFVSGLSIMLEEEGLIESIKKVNEKLAASEPAVPESPKQPKSAPVEKLIVPKKEISEEAVHTFEEFVTMEFFKRLETDLEDIPIKKEREARRQFVEIMLKSLGDPLDPHATESLKKQHFELSTIFPWKSAGNYEPGKIMSDFNPLVSSVISLIKSEDKELITLSVEKGEIVIPESGVIPEFEKEEVSEKPMTIDALLSEYFQAEVNDYIVSLRASFDRLEESPADQKSLKELIKTYYSFKEVSMIHGYLILEDFSSAMLAIFNQARKEKYVYNRAAKGAIDDLLKLFKKTDHLKDPKVETAASIKLDKLLEEFITELFIPAEAVEEKSEKAEKAASVEPEKAHIDWKNQTALISVFSDLLKDLKPLFKKDLAVKGSDLSHLQYLVNQLLTTAGLIGHKEIITFFQNFMDDLFKTKWVDDKKLKKSKEHLLKIYSQAIKEISADFKYADHEPVFTEFRDTYLGDTVSIDFDDTDELIQIVAHIEESHINGFLGNLDKIFISDDQKVRSEELKHFTGFKKNLELIGCDSFVAFPQYFIDWLETGAQTTDHEILERFDEAYRAIIQAIRAEGASADISTKLQSLKDYNTEYASQADAEIQSTEDDTEMVAEAPDDTMEEDLDEIFKQESEKYMQSVSTALTGLSNNPGNHRLYEEIEKNFHSLKSSARLMGYDEVGNLSAPMEEIFENLRLSGNNLSHDDLEIMKDVVKGINAGIAGDSLDHDALLQKLKLFKVQKIKTETGPASKPTDAEPERKEEQLFTDDGSEDEDLLDIFKEESGEYISVVESANAALAEKPDDQKSLSQLENAMHSLKTAAKMLGFSEIGNIADAVELTAVAIQRGEIKNNPEINENITAAITLVQELTNGDKKNIGSADEIISRLSVQAIKKSGTGQEGVAENSESILMAELDEQTKIFVKEGWEVIEKINHDLVSLEKSPGEKKLIDQLNRSIHTLKGSAQLLDFQKIGKIAHRIEDLFAYIKEENKQLEPADMDVLFQAVDKIQDLLGAIKAGKSESETDIDPTIALVQETLAKLSGGEFVAETGYEKAQTDYGETSGAKDVTGAEAGSEQYIKITTGNLDNLVNMAAELVINKTQLSSYLEKLKKLGETLETDKKKLGDTNRSIDAFLETLKGRKEGDGVADKFDEAILKSLSAASVDFNQLISTYDTASDSFRLITREFEQNLGQIASLTKALHDDILQVRMVPTEILFNRYPRAIRDLARKLNKKINLVIEGEKTEMDRAMIESLADPVMHLIRNAVDHGIESPEERKKQGKSEDGIVLLNAKRSKSQVVIEVQDDGRGIDPDLVKEKIVSKNLASKEDVKNMNVAEVMAYVFHPGFSTREKASEVSGRGVGLDVVADHLKALKGSIQINSTPGKGTIFRIQVPMTLAIAQVMMVKVDSESIAIPLSSIEETVQFKDPELVEKDEKAFITFDNQLIQVLYLSSLLNYGDKKSVESAKSHTVLIVQEAGTRYGLIVDLVIGREEIVIKSLDPNLADIPYVAGGTVAGDGSVILILDIPSITKMIESEGAGEDLDKDFVALDKARKNLKKSDGEKAAIPARKKTASKSTAKTDVSKSTIKGRSPRALIVDDSVSVRKFVSSVLEKNKYETILAEDGPEALEELRKQSFDIIITDLEMPKMQGFELIEEIRKYKKYQSIPIVILTGRAGKKHKDKGIEIGANAYITKPFKENDLLKSLEEFIEIE